MTPWIILGLIVIVVWIYAEKNVSGGIFTSGPSDEKRFKNYRIIIKPWSYHKGDEKWAHYKVKYGRNPFALSSDPVLSLDGKKAAYAEAERRARAFIEIRERQRADKIAKRLARKAGTSVKKESDKVIIKVPVER